MTASDPCAQLISAVQGKFGHAAVTLESSATRRWATATFSGVRFEMTFSVEGGEAEQSAATFVSDLHEAEFPMAGYILADIALVKAESFEGGELLSIEALIVEDA
jgi:hypothetical protein